MKPTNILLLVLLLCFGCSKKESAPAAPEAPAALRLVNATLNGNTGTSFAFVNLMPVLRYSFSEKADRSTAAAAIVFADASGVSVPFEISWENGDSALLAQPKPGALEGLGRYTVVLDKTLKSAKGAPLFQGISFDFSTRIDSTAKFPIISDDSLLTLIQKQSFKYFWDFGHPVSGLARERNTSGDVVTSGGSGFGIMALVAAVDRSFISRQQGFQRLATMVDFLQNKTQRFKGAYPHWINGSTGVVVPFSAADNGADLVETSYLAMGLLCAREYFDGQNQAETTLRNNINTIMDGIEWNWFRKNNINQLYWHWSATGQWAINMPITGWNECLITYVMAAASRNFSIPDTVYHKGFAGDGAMKNGKQFFGHTLPLGEDYGGPLFFSQYSFLGLNPNGLIDKYASYQAQNTAHSNINFEYCKSNPKNWQGYSNVCWGITASDIPNGYSASSPKNDLGVIAPTAAISALPYTPQQSMAAIKFFYYTLGNKIWKDYGFVDAFKLQDLWFASSFLAIDQGPQIVMIENHRTGLLWKLFTGCPEVKAGLRKLGFTAPYL